MTLLINLSLLVQGTTLNSIFNSQSSLLDYNCNLCTEDWCTLIDGQWLIVCFGTGLPILSKLAAP